MGSSMTDALGSAAAQEDSDDPGVAPDAGGQA
jgi:hypothetical protein